jgi:hypothetical protein
VAGNSCFPLKFSNLHFCVLKTGSVEVSGSNPLSSINFPLSIKGLREEGNDLVSGEQKLARKKKEPLGFFFFA